MSVFPLLLCVVITCSLISEFRFLYTHRVCSFPILIFPSAAVNERCQKPYNPIDQKIRNYFIGEQRQQRQLPQRLRQQQMPQHLQQPQQAHIEQLLKQLQSQYFPGQEKPKFKTTVWIGLVVIEPVTVHVGKGVYIRMLHTVCICALVSVLMFLIICTIAYNTAWGGGGGEYILWHMCVTVVC